MNLRRQAIKYFTEAKSSEPELYLATARYLQHGESFLLPEGGYFFDADKDIDIPLEGMRLPFDTCILEWTREDPDLGRPVHLMSILQQKDGKLAVIPVWAEDAGDGIKWMPAVVGLVISDGEIVSTRDGMIRVKAQVLKNPTRNALPEVVFDAKNYLHEISVAAQFLLLANCGNVSPLKIHEPSDKQRRAASRRGNAPFHSYWTLDCALPSSPAEARSLGGTHAAPRLHMRRGHVRRLPTGRTTWVRQCAVGNANLGAVSKDYAVHA